MMLTVQPCRERLWLKRNLSVFQGTTCSLDAGEFKSLKKNHSYSPEQSMNSVTLFKIHPVQVCLRTELECFTELFEVHIHVCVLFNALSRRLISWLTHFTWIKI